MAYKFPRLSPSLLTKVRSLFGRARAHRFWFVTVTVTLVTVLGLFLIGYTSVREARALRTEEERIAATLEQVDRWVAAFQAPTPRESLTWDQSRRVLETLQDGAAEPAAVAALLARRAQALGIGDVRMRFSGDSTALPPGRSLGSWTLAPQAPLLQVELDATHAQVVAFIDALPPHIEVREVQLVRHEGAIRGRFIVAAYRAQRG
jgi:hypothetical protein